MPVRGEGIQRQQRQRLSRRQAERGSKAFGDAEQSDHHPASCWGAGIASQPFCPREPIVCTLCPGKRRRLDGWIDRDPGLHLDLHALLTKQIHACTSMVPTTPIPPGQGRRTDDEWMQQHTHPTRLGGGSAMPLTLSPAGTGATTANASRIDHAQATVGFSAPLVRNKRLPGRTAQRSIRLEGIVSPREAALFPGQGL